jgi:threonine synthase
VVCIVTGHGLKDADAAAAYSPEPEPVDATAEAVTRAAQ